MRRAGACRVAIGVMALLMMNAAARADTVKGSVLGPDGKPVADARVWVRVFGRKDRSETEVKSDAAGRFSLNYVREYADMVADGGVIGLAVIYAPGFALSGGRLKEIDNTFQLERGGQLSGFVRDVKGQPVAGARVRINNIQPDDDPEYLRWVRITNPSLQETFSAKTSADGRWTISDVPTTGQIGVLLDDPAYVRLRADTEAGTDSLTLRARAGATLHGRVMYEDGKPAAGVHVHASADSSGEAQSAADGSYQITSLPSGVFALMGELKGGQWVAPMLNGIAIKEGAQTQAPDLVLTKGALVEGTVVDDETGKPLAGVDVRGDRTRKDGRFQVRFVPGEVSLDLYGVPDGYLRPEHNTKLVLKKGDKKTVVIRLKKGLTLSGTAVDSDGKPAVGAKLKFIQHERHVYHEPIQVVADAAGAWNVTGLEAGKMEFLGDGEWQVVEPKSVALPLERSRVIEVKVEKIALQNVTGRVIDTKGEPVAGAKIAWSINIPAGEDYGTVRTQRMKSDKDGQFTLHDVRPDHTLNLSIEKSGFRFDKGGEVKRVNGAWQVSDAVLTPLGNRILGQVLMRGAPVAGARVFSPDGVQAQTTSDETGHFTLDALPQGEIQIMAARGADWAQTRVGPDVNADNVKLELAPLIAPKPSDLARGYAILEAVLKESKGTKYYARAFLPFTLTPYDFEGALRLAAQTGEAAPDWILSGVIQQLIESDPARAAQWAPGQLDKIADARQRAETVASLGLAFAETNPTLAAEMLRRAREWQAPKTIDGQSVYTGFFIAALAARLESPDANKIFGDALVLTLNSFPDNGPQSAGSFLVAAEEVAARGSLELVEKIAEQLPPGPRVHGLSRAAAPLAKHDLAGARKLLDEIAAIKVVEKTNIGNEDPEYAFGLAAKPIIVELRKTDSAAALALARRVSHSSHRAMALALAAQSQSAAKRAEIFREAMAATREYGESTKSQIAAMAYEIDPVLGAALFEEARAALPAASQYNSDDAVAAYAFYAARIAPAESRLMLEQSFAQLRQNANSQGWNFKDVVLAMSAADVDRALEMARALPDDDVSSVLPAGAGEKSATRFDLQRKIAQYIIAPDRVRRTMPFNRWNASDNWTPGTDSGW